MRGIVMTRHFALLAMLAAALLPSAARAQDANADGQASVRIVKPLSLANYADLDFGTVVITGLGAGTVTIDPNAMPGPYFRESDLQQQAKMRSIDFQGPARPPE